MPVERLVGISASVASGRNVVAASGDEPYRPMPSPPTAFKPKSTFLFTSDQRALAPTPPPSLVSLNAPTALGVVEALTGQATVTGAAGTGKLPAFVPTTPHGKIRSRKVLTMPRIS